MITSGATICFHLLTALLSYLCPMQQNRQAYSRLIKSEAKKLGFLFCGISKAEFLEEEAPRLESWLKQNMQGEMHYMENYFDKRLDPRLLVDGAKSVISLGLNYYTEQQQSDL